MIGQRKIGVLMGGLSAERDTSIRTGEAVLGALSDRGYDAWPLFVDRDVDMVLRQSRIDVAFLALHGRYGEDGCIQGLLELRSSSNPRGKGHRWGSGSRATSWSSRRRSSRRCGSMTTC